MLETKIEFDKLSAEVAIAQFGKLTADLKEVPTQRRKIRERVNPHTVNLIKALNEFIQDGKKHLPKASTQLAAIVNNLDRMVLIPKHNGPSNHEEIFLDRSGQLKALGCHLIYTVPDSMVYSNRATDLRDIYGEPQTLPMIMVQTQSGAIYPPGINKIKELIAKRVEQVVSNLSLETQLYDSPETLEALCRMSGSHVGNLLLLIQSAIDETDKLPISRRSVQIAITDARDAYRRTVTNDQWSILAAVSHSKQILNDEQHRNLLFSRCILEYTDFDGETGRKPWYDVHPLIVGIAQFQDDLAKFQP